MPMIVEHDAGRKWVRRHSITGVGGRCQVCHVYAAQAALKVGGHGSFMIATCRSCLEQVRGQLKQLFKDLQADAVADKRRREGRDHDGRHS